MKRGLWGAVALERTDGGAGGGNADNNASAQLQTSIANLTQAIKDLRHEIGVFRENMRTDFSRLVDRQDPQFRWLAGLIVAAAIAITSMIYKTGHP